MSTQAPDHLWFDGKYEPDPNTGCWLWLRRLGPGGYGRATHSKRTWLAHRLSYRLFKADPGASQVCHRCDTPACINPAHLFLGTQQDNVLDRQAKGRARGRSGPSGGLSAAAREDILANCRAGARGRGVRAFARKHGITPSSVRWHLRALSAPDDPNPNPPGAAS